MVFWGNISSVEGVVTKCCSLGCTFWVLLVSDVFTPMHSCGYTTDGRGSLEPCWYLRLTVSRVFSKFRCVEPCVCQGFGRSASSFPEARFAVLCRVQSGRFQFGLSVPWIAVLISKRLLALKCHGFRPVGFACFVQWLCVALPRKLQQLISDRGVPL